MNKATESYKDMIGKKYERLTVICKAPTGIAKTGERTKMICRCDCGTEKIINASDIKKGKTKSCGCLRSEKTSERFSKHKDTDNKLYKKWIGIKNRCLNENSKSYINYGLRGISICKEWTEYEKFKEWAINNGYSNALTIERINVDGNYSPENCTWIPKSFQNRNTRKTVRYTICNQEKTLAEWCELFDIPLDKAHKRIYSGKEPFTIEDLYKKIMEVTL